MRRILDSVVPPSSGTRFPALDGLRGMAVLMVLLGHTYKGSGAAGTGVCIFFVLSAFLLFYPWATDKPIEVGPYYRRRFRRIYPAWVFSLLVGTAASLAIGISVTWGGFLTHLIFAHTLAIRWVLEINPPTWSMAPEVQFYLALPLLALAARRWRWLPILGIVTCSVWQSLVGTQSSMWQNWPLLGLPFFCGMVAAYAVRSNRTHAILGPLGLAVIAAVCVYVDRNVLTLAWGVGNPRGLVVLFGGPRGLLTSLGATAAIIALTRADGIAVRAFSAAPIRAIGVCGYSIFLLHYPLWQMVSHFTTRLVVLVGVVPVSLAIGVWSYLNIELPFIRSKGRVHESQPGAPIPTCLTAGPSEPKC